MEFEHVLNVEVCCTRCIDCRRRRAQVNTLAQTMHKGKNGIKTIGCLRKTSDQIHADVLPRVFRNRQGLEQIIVTTSPFHSLAEIARTNISFAHPSSFRPIHMEAHASISTVASLMTSRRQIMIVFQHLQFQTHISFRNIKPPVVYHVSFQRKNRCCDTSSH